MNALGSVALVTFGGIIPVTSHIAAIVIAVRGSNVKTQMRVAKSVNASDRARVSVLVKVSHILRNIATISLVRDLLGMAAVVTLACLSILTPVMAIGIGAALLLGIILSSVAIGQSVSVINAGEHWQAQMTC